MKKIGIVGGTAWLSTAHYYSELCRLGEERFGKTPVFSIESLDLQRAVSYIGDSEDEESWANFDAYHREALLRVAACGSEVAFLAANTPHHRFEAITRDVPLRVVHIVDAVAQTAKALQFDSLLLLGTRLTMESAPIRLRFASHSVPVAAPSPDKQSRLISLIQRLQSAQTTGAAQEIARLSQGSRAVVLGCTELALAFPHAISMPVFEEHGRTYLNSLAIHIRAILDAVAART